VKYLIEAGANVNAISNIGETPFDVIKNTKKKKRAFLREAGGKKRAAKNCNNEI